MPIAITEPTVEILSTANATSYAMGAFTPTANALLVVMVFATGTVAAAPTMSGGSLLWERIGAAQLYNSTDTAYCFIAQAPASPTSATITFDCTADAATGAMMHVFQITGHNSFQPLKQIVTATGTGANPTFTVAAANTANGYMGGFGINRAAPASTPPASWTETADTGYTSPAAGGTAAFRAGGETGTSFVFTTAAGNWAGYFVEINEAAIGSFPNSPTGEFGFFGA